MGYGIRLCYNGWVKDFRFMPSSETISGAQWNSAVKELETIGDSSPDSRTFFQKVEETFNQHGFQPVAK